MKAKLTHRLLTSFRPCVSCGAIVAKTKGGDGGAIGTDGSCGSCGSALPLAKNALRLVITDLGFRCRGKREEREKERESLQGSAGIGALGVVSRDPAMILAYLAFICQDDDTRRAFQQYPVSAREKQRLDAVLNGPRTTDNQSKMKKLWLEMLREEHLPLLTRGADSLGLADILDDEAEGLPN